MAFDNNGIINMTKNATSMYSESQEKDKVAVKELSNSMKEKIKRNSSESGDQEQEEIKYYSCEVSIQYNQTLHNVPKNLAKEAANTEFNYKFIPIESSPSPNRSDNDGAHNFILKGDDKGNLNLNFEKLEANKWYNFRVMANDERPTTEFMPATEIYTVRFLTIERDGALELATTIIEKNRRKIPRTRI